MNTSRRKFLQSIAIAVVAPAVPAILGNEEPPLAVFEHLQLKNFADLKETIPGYLTGRTLVFTDGAAKGLARVITGYDPETNTVNVFEDFSIPPGANDSIVIV